ncbi:MAG: hypothetical protein HXY43_05090 [Fischerella sp.]|jgi:hypothetical protein|uniref:hypothetical protein n=1 Tax=Fischerella sp. TaxID=1191 RepID=UPI0017C8FD70|nr:hypothetical protein [Fischerella sp.]NWF58690.1 hypothetical protein [Fischerella sp.]
MIISDLNHLEAVEGEGIVGGSYPTAFDIKFNKDFKKNINIKSNVVSSIVSKPEIKGNVAEGEAVANAFGKDTYSDAETATEAVEDKYSASIANSVSAVY